MIWLQGILCFILWLGFGLYLRRGADGLRSRLSCMGRGRKVLLATACFFASLGLLFLGLAAVTWLGGMGQGSLKWWAVPAVAIVGSAFILLQVLAAGSLVTLIRQDETEHAQIASERQKYQRKENKP